MELVTTRLPYIRRYYNHIAKNGLGSAEVNEQKIKVKSFIGMPKGFQNQVSKQSECIIAFLCTDEGSAMMCSDACDSSF